MGYPEAADPLSIYCAWVMREAALDKELRGGEVGADRATSLLAEAVYIAGGEAPLGRLVSTVFFRERRAWTEAPYYDVGIQVRSMDAHDEAPVEAVFGTMWTIEGGEIEPEDGVDPEYAAAVGTLAMAKQRWAALRGLELSDDATCLILPPLTVAQLNELLL